MGRSTSLKHICKKRILDDMVRRVQGGYFAMVVDANTLHIISACCNVYDVLDEGVTVVEMIHKKRQALPKLDAVYFISPTVSNVELVLSDFKNSKKPQYKSVYLFFSNPLGSIADDLFDMIAMNNNVLSRLRTVVEFNMDFVSYEAKCFHFASSTPLSKMFPECSLNIIEKVTDQIFSVCCSLGYQPVIRYQSDSMKGVENQTVAEAIAVKLNKRTTLLDSAQYFPNGEMTLLILDRSFDLVPLFIHDYGYQALAYDLLDIPLCQEVVASDNEKGKRDDDTYEYQFSTNAGKVDSKRALLSEADEIWERLKHLHITTANKTVSEETKQFAKDNVAAQLSKGKNLSNEETLQAIRALPQYQEMLGKYWLHVTMSEHCFKQLKEKAVMAVGSVEQDLATGVTKDGKRISTNETLKSAATALSNQSVGSDEKIRLLLLFFSQIMNMMDKDRNVLIEAGEFSHESTAIIRAVLALGLHDASSASSLAPGSPAMGKHVHRSMLSEHDAKRCDYFSNRAKTVELELSRFEPKVKMLMTEALEGKLHRGKYRYLSDPTGKAGMGGMLNEKSNEAEGRQQRVKARNADWDWGAEDAGTAGGGGTPRKEKERSDDKASKKQKLCVFVLGGISMSELRCAYEVSRSMDAEVYIGGTNMFVPRTFLESIRSEVKKGM
eukprot:GHVN01106094.1.p1 GENE.GHVN01106094.1~~GHVN01106094.1.p1  ORF type:complete len:666 (-),score=125.30 GHVN01106094.1:189-2186(-)